MFVIVLTTAIGAIAGGAGVMIFGSSAGVRREARAARRRRDEPDFTLTLQAPDRVAQRARKWTGLNILHADVGVGVGDNRESMLV